MKHTYRVKNWKQYNRSLINRGNLTFWLDEDALKNWLNDENSSKRGRPRKYSDLAIEVGMVLRTVYGLPLRQLQGFLEGIFHMMGIPCEVPDYTTFSRRSSDLKVSLNHLKSNEPIHLLIDATGLKIHGEGEWQMKMHGKSRRRSWKKFHISIDWQTREITAVSLTKSNVHDSTETANLIESTEGEIASVAGDMAYDNCHSYNPIAKAEAYSRIPPRSGAALGKGGGMGTHLRNLNIKNCWILGKDDWKKDVGYHDRSLVENAFYRYKTIIGPKLRSRNHAQQTAELRIGAQILNRMTHLGMPKTERAN